MPDESVGFELPGHAAIVIPNPALPWTLDDVTRSDAPCLQVASWNHLFLPPDSVTATQYWEVVPFPPEEWRRLKMNRRRAEIAKQVLVNSERVEE